MKHATASRKGIASILLLVGLTALLVIAAGAIASISFNENSITASALDGEKALLYAESGARDALRKLSLNLDYTDTSGNYRINYNSPTGSCASSLNGCAQIKVTTTSPRRNPIIITAIGQSGSAERKIQVDVTADNLFKIGNANWVEIANSPAVLTSGAINVSSSTATLKGWVNPNIDSLSSARAWFRYGANYAPRCVDDVALWPGSSATATQSFSGSDPVSFSQDVSGLSSGTPYFYCAIADDGSGNNKVYGQVYRIKTL